MEYVTLGNYCSITSSKRIFAEQYVEKGVPFYRSKEIIEKNNGQDISEPLYIEPEVYETIKKKFGVPQQGGLRSLSRPSMARSVLLHLRGCCKTINEEKTVQISKSIVDGRAAQPLKRPAKGDTIISPGRAPALALGREELNYTRPARATQLTQQFAQQYIMRIVAPLQGAMF